MSRGDVSIDLGRCPTEETQEYFTFWRHQLQRTFPLCSMTAYFTLAKHGQDLEKPGVYMVYSLFSADERRWASHVWRNLPKRWDVEAKREIRELEEKFPFGEGIHNVTPKQRGADR